MLNMNLLFHRNLSSNVIVKAAAFIPTTTSQRISFFLPQQEQIIRSLSSSMTTKTRSSSPRLYKRTQLRGSSRKNKSNNENELYRADRVLANRTGKSRKECFQLLHEKRVFFNNNDDENNTVVVPGPSTKITMNTPLLIDHNIAVPLPPPLLAVYHKPKWVLSVRNDPLGRPCLDDKSNVITNNDSNINIEQMHPVGRLDYDTTGLLLFSSNGQLTQSLLHPKHEIEKEYVATVVGKVNYNVLKEHLYTGVKTGEGIHTANLLNVDYIPNDYVQSYLHIIKSELPKEYNQTDLKIRGYLDVFDAIELSIITLTVSEGKHRMVRRILANTGHPVVSLHRQRLGDISLNNLPVGHIRTLTQNELQWANKQLLQSTNKRSKKEKKKETLSSNEQR